MHSTGLVSAVEVTVSTTEDGAVALSDSDTFPQAEGAAWRGV